eukprot:TRINITY_DN778_c0_g1_i2.p1 TRINITY_DN778_c0_g1~~TRINITY_DN778_c0_g1_i2.p1  ORF type:complete len:365 (-),score=43.86 TRINITY_DN778_c0_g1_i2:182-1276(-)
MAFSFCNKEQAPIIIDSSNTEGVTGVIDLPTNASPSTGAFQLVQPINMDGNHTFEYTSQPEINHRYEYNINGAPSSISNSTGIYRALTEELTFEYIVNVREMMEELEFPVEPLLKFCFKVNRGFLCMAALSESYLFYCTKDQGWEVIPITWGNTVTCMEFVGECLVIAESTYVRVYDYHAGKFYYRNIEINILCMAVCPTANSTKFSIGTRDNYHEILDVNNIITHESGSSIMYIPSFGNHHIKTTKWSREPRDFMAASAGNIITSFQEKREGSDPFTSDSITIKNDQFHFLDFCMVNNNVRKKKYKQRRIFTVDKQSIKTWKVKGHIECVYSTPNELNQFQCANSENYLWTIGNSSYIFLFVL